MRKLKSKIKPTVIMAVILIFSGCAHLTNSGKDPSTAPGPSVASDQFAREIVELALKHLKVYSASTDSAENDETRNWMAALKEIARLSKEITTRNKQIRGLQSQFDKSKRAKLAIKKSNRKLTSEEIKLREKNRKLEESNQKLQKTIEMLKNLVGNVRF
jgi:septal ring factor EnvC (AmiA/AmiB activator)